MHNEKVAEIFDRIADILEFKQDNPFKIRAYRRASQNIRSMSEDIARYAEKDTLTALPGIGKELAQKIKEIISTGALGTYEKLKKEVPPGILRMMEIPGVGPKTAKLFYDKLKVDSIEKLKEKAASGRLSGLPHIKEKTQENILKAIEFMQESSERMQLGMALPLSEKIIEDLKRCKEVDRIVAAGSLRRMKETVRDIDILVTSKAPQKVMDLFVKLPQVKKVIAHGDTKSSIITEEGIQVDLRVVEPDAYGAALLYFTGSKAHNIGVRKIAVKKRLKVNEYGAFNIKTKRKIAGKTEEDVYRSVGLEYIPPEMREDRGEIEAALHRRLPDLVGLEDIRGDLHIHSDASDGAHRIEDIADICKDRGYEYAAITDHSQSLRVANGLSEKEVFRQIERIRRLNSRLRGFRVLTGAEVDIKLDGSLDYPDGVLKELDVVVAAIHTGFKQPKEKNTARVLKAMENRYVGIIAHPTGRLIGTRQNYELDLDNVLRYAKDTGVAIEINGFPDRLDLDDIHTRRAVEMGIKLVVSTDAHAKSHFEFMRLAVSVARRGWARPGDILNTLSAGRLLKALER